MKEYNYYEAVKNDVLDYINKEINFNDFEDLEELEKYLNDTLWSKDRITGNASNSYTFNTWQAEENLAHNFDLLVEALEEFGKDFSEIKNGAEYCDVIIRCYILSNCISDALEEIKPAFDEVHGKEDEDN